MSKFIAALVLSILAGLASAGSLRGEENCAYFAQFAGQVAAARDLAYMPMEEILRRVDASIEQGKDAPDDATWAGPQDRKLIREAVKAIFKDTADPATTAERMFKACVSRK